MYLFFDTETTGLPRDYNAPTSDVDNWPRVVQIAWVVADDTGKELRVQSDIIRPDGFEMLEQLHKKLFDTKLKISHEAVADVRSCVKCFFELKLRGVV